MPNSFRPTSGYGAGAGQNYAGGSSNNAYSKAFQAARAARAALEDARLRLREAEANYDDAHAWHEAALQHIAKLGLDACSTRAESEAAVYNLDAATSALRIAAADFRSCESAYNKAFSEWARAEDDLTRAGMDQDATAGASSSDSYTSKPSDQWRSYGTKPKPTGRDYKAYSGTQQKSYTSSASTAPKQLSVTAAQYLATCKAAFANKATMTTFPAPPAKACHSAGCKASASSRGLSACSCNLRDLFRGLSVGELKADRIMFHPDKFGQCDERVRAKIQKAASEVFVVVEALFALRR